MYTIPFVLLIVGLILLFAALGTYLSTDHDGFSAVAGFSGVVALILALVVGGTIESNYNNRYEVACVTQSGIVVDSSKYCISTLDGHFIDIDVR